jgi:hypothetical protein
MQRHVLTTTAWDARNDVPRASCGSAHRVGDGSGSVKHSPRSVGRDMPSACRCTVMVLQTSNDAKSENRQAAATHSQPKRSLISRTHRNRHKLDVEQSGHAACRRWKLCTPQCTSIPVACHHPCCIHEAATINFLTPSPIDAVGVHLRDARLHQPESQPLTG